MSNECMLTTLDNPYDYFDEFTLWLLYDKEQGYNTCEYLARITKLSDDMTQSERDKEIERAIDEIIKYDFLGIYKKVWKFPNNKNNNEDKDTAMDKKA